MGFVVRRGFVEWDLVTVLPEIERALWEVGVRAALLRRETETVLLAPFVRGVDVNCVEVRSRSKFNAHVHRDDVQVIRVNPAEPVTRDQVRAAIKYCKYIELPLRPLLRDLRALAKWLNVLEPEVTIFSTPVESVRDVKSPLDVAALLVEISGDESWSLPIKDSLGVLAELVAQTWPSTDTC
jgi:hypothetical protein